MLVYVQHLVRLLQSQTVLRFLTTSTIQIIFLLLLPAFLFFGLASFSPLVIIFCFAINPYISQATCCEAGKHCVYCVALKKYPRHTDSMPAGVFPRAPCIHNPFQLLATIFVKYTG